MRNFFYLFGLALAVFCCSKPNNETVPDGMISFRQAGFVPSFSATVVTKATVVTESTLNSSGFNVSSTTGSAGSESSTWNNVAFSKSGDYFVAGEGGKWWPVSDPGYHFYASNSDLTFDAAGCTVAATNETDVVCAYMPSPSYKTTNTLQFNHVFARITDVTFTALDSYTITDISVTITPKTGGTYNLRTGNGQTDGTGWSSLTMGSATEIANTTPGTKSNDLYLVPGDYTLTASWTATKGDYTKTFSNKTCDISVVGGACNVITANLVGNASEIKFNVTVSAWGSNTIVIGTFPTVSASDFELPGDFSVSSTKTVRFALGNLQAVIGSGPTDTYNYTASEWKFAEHQWDYIGNAAGNNSLAAGTTVDLFGWVGTSASYDTYGLCTNTSGNNAYYGTLASDALMTDWGSIPGVVSALGAGWRTLSADEWNYLFSTRSSGATVFGTSDARYAHATINTDGTGINGIILFPDGVTISAGEVTTAGAVNSNSNWGTKCTTAQWAALESKGAVFLPAAGSRYGTTVYSVASSGDYWSSSPHSMLGDVSLFVSFESGYLDPQNGNDRCGGFSVRLSHDSY